MSEPHSEDQPGNSEIPFSIRGLDFVAFDPNTSEAAQARLNDVGKKIHDLLESNEDEFHGEPDPDTEEVRLARRTSESIKSLPTKIEVTESLDADGARPKYVVSTFMNLIDGRTISYNFVWYESGFSKVVVSRYAHGKKVGRSAAVEDSNRPGEPRPINQSEAEVISNYVEEIIGQRKLLTIVDNEQARTQEQTRGLESDSEGEHGQA